MPCEFIAYTESQETSASELRSVMSQSSLTIYTTYCFTVHVTVIVATESEDVHAKLIVYEHIVSVIKFCTCSYYYALKFVETLRLFSIEVDLRLHLSVIEA